MGEINRDCRPDLDPKSRSGFLNVPDLSQIWGRIRIGNPNLLNFLSQFRKYRVNLVFSQLYPIFPDFTQFFPTLPDFDRLYLIFPNFFYLKYRENLRKIRDWPSRSIPNFGMGRNRQSNPSWHIRINRDGHPKLDIDPTRPDFSRDFIPLEISRPCLVNINYN